MSQIHLFDGDDAEDEKDVFSSLPFPQPIRRAAFSAPDFDADEFLAESQRYQTLEDLRAELRKWSRDLEQELVDLVNRDYADFVGLGGSLGGTERQLDEIQAGLQSLVHELEIMAGRLQTMLSAVEKALQERARLRRRKRLARRLIGLHEQLLGLEALYKGGSMEELQLAADTFQTLRQSISQIPSDHPFLLSQWPRIHDWRQKLFTQLQAHDVPVEALSRLDLGTAIQ